MGSPNPASAKENAAGSNYIIFFDTISDIPSLFAKAPSKREIIFLPRETFKGLEEVPKADLPEAARKAVRQYWLDHYGDSIKIITGIDIDETYLRRLVRVFEWYEREYEIPPPFCFLINHIGRLKILLYSDAPEAQDLNEAITIPPLVKQIFSSIGEEDFAEEWIPDNQDEWWGENVTYV